MELVHVQGNLKTCLSTILLAFTKGLERDGDRSHKGTSTCLSSILLLDPVMEYVW
jgi:hypothetical protein